MQYASLRRSNCRCFNTCNKDLVKFNDKIDSDKNSPNYAISKQAFVIMHDHLRGKISTQQAIQSISKIGTTGTYNKLLKGALDSFIEFRAMTMTKENLIHKLSILCQRT